MKRISKLIMILLLCLSMVLQGVPSIAADDADNKPTYKTKYKVEKVKKPPFCITVNGSEDQDFGDALWDVSSKSRINIIGQCDDDKVGSQWQFYVTFFMYFGGNTEPIEGLEGGLKMGLVAQLDGTAKADMIDIAEKKKEEDEKKKSERKEHTPRPTPPKIDASPEEMKKFEQGTKEVYKTEFEVDLQGTINNFDSETVYGKLGKGDQQYEVHADFLPEDTSVKSKGKVKLSVYSENDVVVTIEVEGKTYGPYAGIFTCQEDLNFQRKDSGTWPIWGVWTDVNPYEKMPNAPGDYETIQEQIKENEKPKKINYKEGRWVCLKKGKGEEASTYSTLQVSETDITYEEGEIWPYPGSALFKPKVKTVYSRDMKEELSSYKPVEYPCHITYYTASDRISYQGFGMLIRVRSSIVLGVWSSEGKLPMPNVDKETDIPIGTWYEFKKGGAETDEKATGGFSAAYTFTRLISEKDKSIVIDKGTAIMMPIGDSDIITLSGIESEKIAKDGTKTKSTKEDETIGVTDYSKSEGTIKFNLKEYTSIPGLSLEGNWSTMNPSVLPPDVESGTFKVRDENGNAFDPPEDSQWLEFNKEEKTLTWTKMLTEPSGILVQTGKYRTFGEDLLLLTDIKADFYARPDSGYNSFKQEDYMYGEILLHVSFEEKKVEDEKVPVSLTIEGEGKFLPIYP